MATIYKRGKVWHVQYLENGKLVQRSLKTHSKRLAEIKLGEIRLNREKGLLGLGRKPKSPDQAFNDFESEVFDKKSPPWQKRLRQLFRPFRQWVAEKADAAATDLSASDVERFLMFRREQVSPKTLNEELAIIRRFYRWARHREYITKDPTESVERLKPDPKPIRIFTESEIQLILKHATPTHRPFYQLLLFTGLRDGELRNLEWNDVDLNRRLLFVRLKEDWQPKTRRNRAVPLAREAYELLNALPRVGTYVFSTRNGKKWVPPRQPWVDLLERIKKAEGVDLRGQVSLHTFRHTFATYCLMQGLDIKTVSDFLGYSSVKMTEKYLHLLPDHKIQAIQKVQFLSAAAALQ